MTPTHTLPAALSGFCLFPCRAGTKTPVIKWKDGSTNDSTQIAAWRAAGNNLAVDCNKSGLIIIDVDASKVDRATAWKAYTDLCASWSIPVVQPTTQSARGGWHIPFKRPADLQATDLRGGGTLVKISDVRPLQPGEKDGEVIGFKNRGYCVAPGSYLSTPAGDLPYLAMPDAPSVPPPAPAGLIDALRLPVVEYTASSRGGTGQDEIDVAALFAFLDSQHMFDTEPDWFDALGAIKLALGDTEQGLEVARQITREDATEEALLDRWNRHAASPADKPTVRMLTIATFIDRADKLGRRFHIRRSTAAMFGSVVPVQTSMAAPPPPAASRIVADIASNAGAHLPSVKPLPMTGGQAVLTRLTTPILEDFLASTAVGAPSRPNFTTDIPALPTSMSEHGLYTLINESIVRALAMTEAPKFRPGKVTNALAVLQVAHKDIFDSVKRRIENSGLTLHDAKINLKAKQIEDEVQRECMPHDNWVYDSKNLPESDNPDNVKVFLGIICAELRWNAWLNRPEIQGFEWNDWTGIDDNVISRLKMRALRTGTRFRVATEFLRDTLTAMAQDNPFDPVVSHITHLQWDGVPRLSSWLHYVCGVPNDVYHQAVSRNVVGGMIKRAREPGAKHDEVMILIGRQGTMKSTLCRTLAMQDDWFTDSVTFDGTPQNIVPQLFGKLVVELAELDGMARKEIQHIKAFITRQSDSVTLKYKAYASDFARRCIFIGTSNEDTPLVDLTGNRRFLPVRADNDLRIDWLRDNIEQIVAEAAHLHATGADFSIPREVWDIAAQHQEAARSVNDVEARLVEWFTEAPYTAIAFVSTPDLIELSDIAGWRNVHALRNAVLKRLGFREVLPRIGGAKVRGWFRGPKDFPLRNIEQVTRYQIGKTMDHRPKVTIGRSATAPSAPSSSVGLPPLHPGR